MLVSILLAVSDNCYNSDVRGFPGPVMLEFLRGWEISPTMSVYTAVTCLPLARLTPPSITQRASVEAEIGHAISLHTS